jgi:hypothetical protein
MLEARATLDGLERPLYGPQRPPGDLSAIRRRHFDTGSTDHQET